MVSRSDNSLVPEAILIEVPEIRYFSLGLGISIAVHALCIVLLSVIDRPLDVIESKPKGPVWIDPNPRIFIPPPSIRSSPGNSAPRIGKEGIPVPVPEAPPEATIATQEEISGTEGLTGDGTGLSDGTYEGLGPQGLPEEQPPDEGPIPVEKYPVVVRSVVPKYPVLALRAGLEGTVWLKIWVDKEGKAREVRLIKSDNDIFNDEAIGAAKQFLFTPAVMNRGAVSVWVAIPFRFKLNTN